MVVSSCTPQPAPFRRARRPEQKLLREQQILAAACQLGIERGVRNVTLGDVARSVGLTKSNVLRYFETREAIFLHASAIGYRDWAIRVQDAVRNVPAGSIRPEGLAALLVDTLAADRLFCDLLGDISATFDHNVSVDAARAEKHASLAALNAISTEVAAADTGLDTTATRELVITTVMFAASAWPATHPPENLAELYRTDPELQEFSVEFTAYLTRALTVVIRGLLHEPAIAQEDPTTPQ